MPVLSGSRIQMLRERMTAKSVCEQRILSKVR
jgi:hypothetical protein